MGRCRTCKELFTRGAIEKDEIKYAQTKCDGQCRPHFRANKENNNNEEEEEAEEATSPRVTRQTTSRAAPSPRVTSSPRVLPSPKVTTSPRRPTPTVSQPLEVEFHEEQSTSTPAHNTRSRNLQTITQETIFSMINIHRGHLSAQQASQRKFPKEALAAVLNEETGELMEYRHLVANPKYREIYKPAYGKELGRLTQGIPGIVQGTNTIVFIHKNEVPSDRWKDVTYGRICANF